MKHSKKALKNPIRVALVALVIGMLMRILHWPYAAGIIFTSFAALLVLYVIRFMKKPKKTTIDIIKMALVVFWTTNGLLKILDYSNTIFFQVGTAITFIAWFAVEGTAYFMDQDTKSKNSITDIIWNFMIVLGVLTIILGGLMHLLQWEYSIPTLTVGLTIVASYILKDIFSTPKTQEKDSSNESLYL